MKKILLASAAMIATAGVAAAEGSVEFGGYGRFGLYYDEGSTGTQKETRIEQRFRLNITATAETDAGVKVQGRIRLQTGEGRDGGASGEGPGAAGFAVSYGGLRVDVGHIDDLVDSGDVVDYYGHGLGLTDLIETDASFAGAIDAEGFGSDNIDQQRVKVRYSVGDFTAAASYAEENDATGDVAYYQIGAAYSVGDHTFGIAYGERDNAASDSYWLANVGGDIGALGYNVVIGDADTLDDIAYGLSVSYDISSATELRAVATGGGDDANDDAYGIGFRHKLGGGVSLRGGFAQAIDGDNIADLGIRFDF